MFLSYDLFWINELSGVTGTKISRLVGYLHYFQLVLPVIYHQYNMGILTDEYPNISS